MFALLGFSIDLVTFRIGLWEEFGKVWRSPRTLQAKLDGRFSLEIRMLIKMLIVRARLMRFHLG